MLPGILVGAALGGVVCVLWLFIPSSVNSPPASPPTIAPPALSTSAAPTGPLTGPLPASGAPNAASPGDGERDYLRRAHILVSTAPAESLAMTEAFPAKFPEGKLGQEREIVAIEALLAMGRAPEARARGKLFLTLFPGSPHRPRLEMMIPGLSSEAKSPDP